MSSESCLEVYSDGAARGNPGPAGAGIVVKNGDSILVQDCRALGVKTNNQAEYLALIYALETAQRYKPERVCCYLDSELVVRQMEGRYRVKDAGLKPLFQRAQALAGAFPAITFTHVPREKNRLADNLANRAIDRD